MKKAVGLALVIGLTAGCVSKLDTDRESVNKGTFGTTVVTLMCKRVAYLEDLNDGNATVNVRGDTYRDICRLGLAPPDSAPASLKALEAKRDILIGSVNTTFPDGFLPNLQTFLTSNDFLSLYDSGVTIAATDDLIEALRYMADDQDLAPALARLNHRLGYLPTEQSLGAVRAFVNYPELNDFLLTVTEQITEGGQAKGEFDNLLAALGVTLRDAQPEAQPESDTRTGQLALQLLLSESDLLSEGDSLPIVRRDYRGVAQVAGSGGNVVAPFVNMDNDGLADVDAQGRYVDANGQLIAAPSPFSLPAGEEQVPWQYRDAEGRALASQDGPPLYRYVDLDKTLLSALARDSIQLFDPQKGTALDMLRGASALMSSNPRELVTKTYDNGESLEYRGYDLTASPLLDMLYGYLQILRDSNVFDLLDLAKVLIRDHEPEVSRLAEAVVDAAGIINEHPEAHVDPGAPLADDLIPVIRQILATPGLAEDLMKAMEDPEVPKLALRFRDYMKYKDKFTYDADQNLVGSFATTVDRSQADRAYNRSLMQRLLHLIDDSNGAVLCNKQNAKVTDPLGLGIPLAYYNECDLIEVDNLATFYVQSIALQCDNGSYATRNGSGNWVCASGSPHPKAHLNFNWNNFLIEAIVNDNLIQQMTTIDGFTTHPTPQALNRALFLDPMPSFLANVMDPPVTKYGQQFRSVHAGTLPVWEKDGFYDQIRPIVQAFAKHNAEQLFVDILAVLHKHWPDRNSAPTHQFNQPGQAGYVWGSGAVSYEPAIIDILSRGDTLPQRGTILDALHMAAPVMDNTPVNGKGSLAILTDAARYLLTPQAGLTNRVGATSSQTSEGDPINTLSPFQILADAYADKHARLETSAAEGEAWQSSTGNLVNVLVRAQPVAGVGWQFDNPRFRGMALILIDFLESRLRAHDAAGDRDAWLSQDLPGRLQDVMSGPVFAGAADFILSLQASPEARQQIEQLTAYLVNEANYNEAFRQSLSSIADVVQLGIDDADIVPIAHVLGEALRPERGWVDSHLAFVKAARESDENQALVEMMRNLYVEYRPGHTAIGDLIDGISEVERARPYDDLGADYTAEDYRSMLDNLANFLDDQKRGLRRFISIIQGRNI